jgi:probable rRNA maturation factor
MPRIAVTNRQKELSLSRARIARAARVAAGERWPKGELSVVVVAGDEMALLNRRHTGRRGRTDVLAFPLEDNALPGDTVGEVAVNASLARDEARRRGIDPFEELLLYVVHGVLHLAGYDDHNASDRRKMYARETEVLEKLGVGEVRFAPRKARRPRKAQ